jgi:hypothetical protein
MTEGLSGLLAMSVPFGREACAPVVDQGYTSSDAANSPKHARKVIRGLTVTGDDLNAVLTPCWEDLEEGTRNRMRTILFTSQHITESAVMSKRGLNRHLTVIEGQG